MIVKPFFCIIVFCILFSCSNNVINHSDKQIVSVYKNSRASGKFERVSFNELNRNVANYHNRNIELTGVYQYSFEKSAIYPDEHLALDDDSKRAVWISFYKELPLINTTTGNNLWNSYEELKKLSGKYIRVKGTLDFNSKGHLSEYFAELKKVVQVEVLETK